MTEWNPVKGLKELTWSELRRGDDVVVQSNDNPNSFTRIPYAEPYGLSNSCKYYLIERKVHEPTGLGDVVEVYRKVGEYNEIAVVTRFVRTRTKEEDEQYHQNPWTNADNDVFQWNQISDMVARKCNYGLRILKATYKEEN